MQERNPLREARHSPRRSPRRFRFRDVCGLVGAAALGFLVTRSGLAESSMPTLPLWSASEIPQVCERGLDDAKRATASLAGLPLTAASVKTVLHAFNRLQIAVEDVESVAYIMSNVAPDKSVREAAEACLLKFNEFDTDLLQNPALYARVKAVRATGAADRKYRQNLLEGFEDTGVALPDAKRARMKAVIARLEEVRQEFERNVRDNATKLLFSPDEMKGLPQTYLDKLKRDAEGHYILGFEYPEYGPFMSNADSEDARRRYQFAFTNRGGMRNIELLRESEDLRREMAALFGMKSYAQFSLRRKMAKTPQAAQRFLDGVETAVRDVAKRDVAELAQLKARELGKPVGEVTVHNWDSSYYREKLRKSRYGIEREALRAYFPTDASIAWVLHISSVLYGIEFRPAQIATWHPEVRAYTVHDQGSGRYIGTVYLDLFPREGKFSHAANYGIYSTSTLAERKPVTVLVTNLDRKGLDHGELESLVHEFGHALHHVLADTLYASQGGSDLEWDFVEAPSQMYEEWARRKESLSLISRFCTECKPVDDDLVRRLEGARKVGMGLNYQDQHLLANYDLALYGETPVDPLATWVRMESRTPLGHTPGTLFPSTFEHIIRGYAAGYYGYMWSEVLALDMLSAFGNNIMNPRIGRRFRDAVLSHGGERPAARTVEAFLGRKPNNAAFIAEITGTRKLN